MMSAKTTPVLELRDVSVAFTSGAGAKRRTVRAMNAVTLEVAPGETLGLVGESGSGKTTTASVALGLKRPDSGEVLLLGSPFTAFDVAVQMQILALIRELQAEHRFGALFISHDLGAVQRVADRVAVLFRGDLVETAATDEFFRNPRHPYSQTLLEAL